MLAVWQCEQLHLCAFSDAGALRFKRPAARSDRISNGPIPDACRQWGSGRSAQAQSCIQLCRASLTRLQQQACLKAFKLS